MRHTLSRVSEGAAIAFEGTSKRYRSARELVHDAVNAANRAEGDIVREDFDAFDTRGAEDDGGPAAWGEDPIIGTHQEPSPSGDLGVLKVEPRARQVPPATL